MNVEVKKGYLLVSPYETYFYKPYCFIGLNKQISYFGTARTRRGLEKLAEAHRKAGYGKCKIFDIRERFLLLWLLQLVRNRPILMRWLVGYID